MDGCLHLCEREKFPRLCFSTNSSLPQELYSWQSLKDRLGTTKCLESHTASPAVNCVRWAAGRYARRGCHCVIFTFMSSSYTLASSQRCASTTRCESFFCCPRFQWSRISSSVPMSAGCITSPQNPFLLLKATKSKQKVFYKLASRAV